MEPRIAIAAVDPRAAAIALEIGKSQAAVRGIAALSVAPAAAEAPRDLAVLEVLPAWEVPVAAGAGGNAELGNP